MTFRRLWLVLGASALLSLVAGSSSRALAQQSTYVVGIDPPAAHRGDIVTLRGFGLNTPHLSVWVGGVNAPALSVTPTSITIRVPQNAPTGVVYVILAWLNFPLDYKRFGVIPTNSPPTANAGPDQTITLPDLATLNGVVTDDGLPKGSTLTSSWTKVSGPGSVTFSAPSSPSTTASFSVAGSYVLRLTADDSEKQSSDDVNVVVNPAPSPTIGVSPASFSFTATEGGANPVSQLLGISNTGGGTLNVSVTDDAPWLTVAPGSGTAPVSPTVAVDITGLGANTYNATITIAGAGATNTPVSIPVTLTVADPPQPQISISDQAFTEGDAGSAAMQFAVSLSHATPRTVTVSFTTEDGTAHAGQDYAAGSGLVTFAPGAITQFVNVSVNGDRLNEVDETFAVNLATPVNATIGDPQAIGTIVNDDPLPALRISDATTPEGNSGLTPLSFTVEMINALGQVITSGRTVSVNFGTASGSGADGAIAGEDFVPNFGTLTFLEGESTKPLPVLLVIGDLNVESDETFTVLLTAPVNATIFDASGTGTIVNDDVPTIAVSPESLSFTATAGGANPASQSIHISNTGTGMLNFSVAGDEPWLSLDISSGSAPADVAATVHIGGLAAGSYSAHIGVTSVGATNSPQTVPVNVVIEQANAAPLVNAGGDQTITLPAVAHLSGLVSDDGLPVGAAVTTQWSKASGPGTVTFTDPAATTTDASFSDAGSYVLSLTANDSQLTASDDVTITVLAANRQPVANAGPDASFHLTETAHLDGSASSDPDGDPLTFAWTFVSRPDGSAATLSDPTAVQPTFLVDRAGQYVVQLIVNDGALDSAPDSVTITTQNSAPIANAGPDQTATVTSTVTLNGSGSSDVDGDALTYSWSFASVPSGSNVALSDPSSVTPTFVIDAPGTYDLHLIVNDGVADSPADHVLVSTINSAPVANAGPDQSVFVTQIVTLNASGSSDVDGDPLAYLWQIISAPGGSAAALSDATALMPSFTVDRPGTYVMSLVVSDGFAFSTADTVTITTANSAPVANAGAAQTAFVGNTVTLDGSGSTDVDGDTLTYAWSLTNVPPGSAAVLSDANAVRPTFVVDRPGTYVAQLIVHDGTAASVPATTMVSTLNSAPIANPGPGRTVVAGQLVMLDGTGSSDVDGDPLTYQWSFANVPPGSAAALAGATTAGPSFVVDKLGTFVVQLIVNDGHVNSAPQNVTIDTTNTIPVANAGPDFLGVALGTPVTLDGVLSSDADGHALSFHWSLTAKPAGSGATLSSTTTVSTTLTPDRAGDYVAQLIVNDGFANSAPDTVLVHGNAPPTADAGPDQSVATGAIVPLDGTASNDPEGEPLTFSWQLTSVPAGSTATLNNPSSATPTFVADVSGAYTIQLTVTDAAGAIATDSATVTAAAAALPVVSVVASDAAASESGPDAGTFTFTRTGSTAASLLVHFGVSGTAGGGTDYTPALTGDVTIPSGQPSTTLTITPIDDAVLEGAETVVVTVQSNTSYEVGPQGSATITITDNDQPPITLALVDTPAVGVALTSALAITLGQPAPSGGVSVTVTSDNTGMLTVVPPSTVVILAGASTGQVVLTGVSSGSTFVRAHAAGYNDGVLAVTVTANIIATPITLNVPLAQSTQLAITLTRDAGNTGPVVVSLATSNAAAVTVSTPTVTFAAGQTSANAVVFGQGIGQATITASAPGFASDTTVVTTTANLNIVQSTLTINSVFGAPITIELQSPPGSPIAAPSGGVAVSLLATNPACVSIPASVTIGQGTINTQAQVTYGGSASLPCSTTVTASGPVGVTGDTVNVTVNQAPGIAVGGGTIGGGLQFATSGSLAINNHGGVTVRITSSDPSRVLVAANDTTAGAAFLDIPIANGTQSFNYVLQALDWNDGSSSPAAVTLTATAQAFANGSATVNYVKPAFDIIGLPSSIASFAGNDQFAVRVGIANAGNSAVVSGQSRRFGSTPLVVTVTNSNAAAGEIDVNPSTVGAQVQTLAIAAGQSQTPNGSGAPEFDPISPGTTTVSASIPDFVATTAASQAVTVTGTGINVSAFGSLGGGLQQSLNASLGASGHGGVTVHVASNDPRVLLAPNATTGGTSQSIDVFVANGSTSVSFVAQAEDWQGGVSTPASVTITLSAPGFTNGSSTVSYVQPSVGISGLGTSTTSLTGNDAFAVVVGLPSAGNSTVSPAQARRFGASPLAVTVTNSNATVAEIDQFGGINGAQSQAVQIVAGQSTTPNGAGQVEFDPISPGTTTVSASIPNFAPTTAASVSVTVTGAGITVPLLGAIGGGLQFSTTGSLGASNHGGVTVHVESSDPARVLIAPNATTVGTASVDIPVANGFASFAFVMQAVDWTDGTSTETPVTITASATGFSNGSNTVNYQKPALQISGLVTTATALSPNDAFTVNVGARNATGSAVGAAQTRRFGAAALVVTVTNSNATVAEIDLNGANGAQIQTSQIAAGQSSTPSSGANAFEFDPLGTGTTTVTASIPNFVTTTAGSQAVVVNTPVITVPLLGTLGGGLQSGVATGTLGSGTEHGAMTLHLVSSDPTRIILAANTTTAGDPSGTLDVPVAAGASQYSFVVQALDWVEGVSTPTAVTITASAPGFTSGTNSVSYVQPAVAVALLVTSISSSAANDDFVVQVGVPNNFNTALAAAQNRRIGGSPIVATVTNGNSVVAELDQNGGLNGAQSQTAQIMGGQNSTPNNLAGGLEFDPLAAGSTNVAVAPLSGFIHVNTATQTVTVTP